MSVLFVATRFKKHTGKKDFALVGVAEKSKHKK